jgi:hypothetical protein
MVPVTNHPSQAVTRSHGITTVRHHPSITPSIIVRGQVHTLFIYLETGEYLPLPVTKLPYVRLSASGCWSAQLPPSLCVTFCLTLRRVTCSKTDMASGSAAGSGPLRSAERCSLLVIAARTALSCSESVVVISATTAAETLCEALRRGLPYTAAGLAGGGGTGEPNGDAEGTDAGASGGTAGSTKGVVGAYARCTW